MSQQDYRELVALIGATLLGILILVLIGVIVKWKKIAKRALRDSNKPITLNQSLVGCHFFIHSFYPKKQLSGEYEGVWLADARIEGKEGMPVLKITDQQASVLVNHPEKMFVLKKDGDKLSFHVVLSENELFFKLRHKE